MKALKIFGIIVLVFLLAIGVNAFLSSKTMMELSRERMDHLNPTEYTFDHPIDSVKKVIEKNLRKSRCMILKRKVDMYFENMIKNEIGRNDYILHDIYDSQSFVYRVRNRGRYYFFALQIHLDSLDEGRTRVKIITHDSKIISGYRFGEGLMCFFVPVYQYVDPSTIEEYQVIWKIGKSLGEQMPAVIYPASLSEAMIRRTYYSVGPNDPDNPKWFDTMSPWE